MGSLLRSVNMGPPGSPRMGRSGSPRDGAGMTVVCGIPAAESTMGWLAMALLVFQGTALLGFSYYCMAARAYGLAGRPHYSCSFQGCSNFAP